MGTPRCSNWWRPRPLRPWCASWPRSPRVARDGAHWLLRVERESLNQPTARERLRAPRWRLPGHATQISVEVGRVIDSPARRNAAAAAERQRLAEEIVMNDPMCRR